MEKAKLKVTLIVHIDAEVSFPARGVLPNVGGIDALISDIRAHVTEKALRELNGHVASSNGLYDLKSTEAVATVTSPTGAVRPSTLWRKASIT